jgi:hypothetical protein
MSEGTLLLWLAIGFVVLPVAAGLEYLTPVQQAQVVHEEVGYSADLQKELMNQLEGPVKLFRPKTAKERAEAIADLWSLDPKKSLKLAMR